MDGEGLRQPCRLCCALGEGEYSTDHDNSIAPMNILLPPGALTSKPRVSSGSSIVGASREWRTDIGWLKGVAWGWPERCPERRDSPARVHRLRTVRPGL